MHKSAREYVDQYMLIINRADSEGRDLTATERHKVADLVEHARTAKSVEDFSHQLGATASEPAAKTTRGVLRNPGCAG
jgi:hypothetical protein